MAKKFFENLFCSIMMQQKQCEQGTIKMRLLENFRSTNICFVFWLPRHKINFKENLFYRLKQFERKINIPKKLDNSTMFSRLLEN